MIGLWSVLQLMAPPLMLFLVSIATRYPRYRSKAVIMLGCICAVSILAFIADS
jgi:hypothetical protein